MPSVDNLIQGTGYLYWAPTGTSEPADADAGAEPESPWVNLGFTKDGVSLSINQEFSELEVDQVIDTVERRIIKRDILISTNLAEATLDNLSLLQNQLATTATVTGASGHQTYEPLSGPNSVQPDYFMLIFDGVAPSSERRRVIIRRALQIGGVEVAYAKDDQAVFNAEFAAHHVSDSVRPFKLIDVSA